MAFAEYTMSRCLLTHFASSTLMNRSDSTVILVRKGLIPKSISLLSTFSQGAQEIFFFVPLFLDTFPLSFLNTLKCFVKRAMKWMRTYL
jgi:hypothetical protein